MVVIGTQEELDWLFDALGAAGVCEGCPARPFCNLVDDREEAMGIPIPDRISCGEMQRSTIETVQAKLTRLHTKGGRDAGRK